MESTVEELDQDLELKDLEDMVVKFQAQLEEMQLNQRRDEDRFIRAEEGRRRQLILIIIMSIVGLLLLVFFIIACATRCFGTCRKQEVLQRKPGKASKKYLDAHQVGIPVDTDDPQRCEDHSNPAIMASPAPVFTPMGEEERHSPPPRNYRQYSARAGSGNHPDMRQPQDFI